MDETEEKGSEGPKPGGEEWSGYTNVTLALRACPDCGRHGQVVVMRGEVVVAVQDVISRDMARSYNTELVRLGGRNQENFLAQVAEATYLLDEESGVTVLFGGVLLTVRTARPRRPTQLDLRSEDLTGAMLKLEPCSCRKHGAVVLELPDGRRMSLARPKTKFEACVELERLVLSNRTFPEQPEFVQAVQEAEWLPGPMPVEL